MLSKGRHSSNRWNTLVRMMLITSLMATIATAGIMADNIARRQVIPHCHWNGNCICREFGKFHPGHNKCSEYKP